MANVSPRAAALKVPSFEENAKVKAAAPHATAGHAAKVEHHAAKAAHHLAKMAHHAAKMHAKK